MLVQVAAAAGPPTGTDAAVRSGAGCVLPCEILCVSILMLLLRDTQLGHTPLLLFPQCLCLPRASGSLPYTRLLPCSCHLPSPPATDSSRSKSNTSMAG